TSRAREGAFTLVELLVVISIIALLIAILLPALTNARAAAKAIKCSSNFRQLGVAAHQYVTDWKEYMFPGDFGDTSGAPSMCWQNYVYVNYVNRVKEALQCPAIEKTANKKQGQFNPTNSYSSGLYNAAEYNELDYASYIMNVIRPIAASWSGATTTIST